MNRSGELGVALYGHNGHQLAEPMLSGAGARCVAVCDVTAESFARLSARFPDLRTAPDLDGLLALPGVELVALCSPRRADQAEHALRCMAAGKHVYAEKPCALDEEDLDRLVGEADRRGVTFREMAGTAFEEPFASMRDLVREGAIGDIVQIVVQKSYPYHDRRPGGDAADGGLLRQAGVHAMRFIEHVGGARIISVRAVQTRAGCPTGREPLVMAASWICELENGGVASAAANYLNPPGFGRWGNDMLRLFGTRGLLEATDGGTRTRWIREAEDRGPLPPKDSGPDDFSRWVAHLTQGAPMPLSAEEELHPTRMVLRAHADCVP